MRVLFANNGILTIKFKKNEYEMIIQVLSVPLHAFGLKQLLETTRIMEKDARDLEQKIRQNNVDKDTINFEHVSILFTTIEIINLKSLYTTSCDIIDPIEMHTLTGFTWEEAMEVKNQLEMICRESNS